MDKVRECVNVTMNDSGESDYDMIMKSAVPIGTEQQLSGF